MKKLFSSLIIFSLLLFMVWVITGWFIGATAESTLKNYLAELERIPGEKLFRAELVEYKKTMVGAKARIKISSDTSFLNERLGDFELDAHFLNGPVFVGSGIHTNTSFFDSFKLTTGNSRWKIAIVENSIDETKVEYIMSIFPNGLPVAIVRTDFDNKAYYHSELSTKYADAKITGTFDLEKGDNQGTINVSQIEYGIPPRVITAENATIHYKHQRGITSAYKPGTTNLTVSALTIHNELFLHPLTLNVSADIAIQSELNNVLNGLFIISLEKIARNSIPLDNAKIKIQFANIPASGFIQLSEEQAKHDNIRQQIQWTLEEKGEFPEGQDQLWQLNDQLQILQQQLPEKIAGLFLNSNNSKISINVNAHKKALANDDLKTHQSSSLNGNISLDNSLKNDHKIKNLIMGKGEMKLSNDLFQYLFPFFKLVLNGNPPPSKGEFNYIYEQGELSVNN